MNSNDFSENTNPFENKEFDFYDEITCKDAKQDFSKFFLGLFIFNMISYTVVFAVTEVLVLILGIDKMAQIVSSPYYNMLLGVLPMYTIALPVLLFLTRKIPSRKPVRQDFSARTFFALIPITMLFLTVGNSLGLYFNTVIGILLNAPIENQTATMVENAPMWLTVLLVVIVAPIVEEFIFRKLMIEKLSRYGYVTAILVSSIAFGLFHGNFYQFFYATFVGLVLGYIFVKSGSWLLSVLMHTLVNFYGSVVTILVNKALARYLELYDAYMANEAIDQVEFARCSLIASAYSMLHIGLLVLGIVFFIIAIKKRRIVIADTEAMPLPKGRRFNTVAIHVGGLLFFISSFVILTLSIF